MRYIDLESIKGPDFVGCLDNCILHSCIISNCQDDINPDLKMWADEIAAPKFRSSMIHTSNVYKSNGAEFINHKFLSNNRMTERALSAIDNGHYSVRFECRYKIEID